MVDNYKKTVLITGASGGIGLELALLFAADNINLVLVARTESKLIALQKMLESEYTVEVKILVADLSKDMVCQVIFNEIKHQGIRIDYLVNNAGVGDFGIFVNADWARCQQMIDLNVKALTQLTQLFIPGMLAHGGRIMNVASTAAFQSGPLMAVYYASKAYVLSFSLAIANELEGKVTVTALCPGPTSSGFQQAAGMVNSKLFTRWCIPSSKVVAIYGYKVMMQGKQVAIYGIINWFLANTVRFLPRIWVAKLVRFISEEK